jgi:hypothetical protein
MLASLFRFLLDESCSRSRGLRQAELEVPDQHFQQHTAAQHSTAKPSSCYGSEQPGMGPRTARAES